VNEYTRREEIFWTLVTVFILMTAEVVTIVRLVRAKGPMVRDPEAIQALQTAETAKADFAKAKCPTVAKKLGSEVGIFRTRAESAEKEAKDAAAKARPPKKGAVDYTIPWAQAANVLKQAKALKSADCRRLSDEAVASANAAPGWKAVEAAAALSEGGDEKAQQETAKKLLGIFKSDKELSSIALHAEAAGKALEEKRVAADEGAKNLIQATGETCARAGMRCDSKGVPEGLFPMRWAMAVGIAVALAALVISYLSVRSASMRRAKLLVALRRFANTPEAGLQAAAIVRLAAHHNGGEPGMVMGAALGGVLAALFAPTENPNVFIADLFVAGSMGGLLVGLGGQWLFRTLVAVKKWRDRSKELGDIEKPTIPVALVLGGVTPGLEKQFLRYFEALPIGDASMVVQKLAAQAEEQILAAADAAAQQQLMQQQQMQQQQQMMAQQGGWGPPQG
jgi:hypothetical protein